MPNRWAARVRMPAHISAHALALLVAVVSIAPPASATLIIRDLIDDATLNCDGATRFYDQCYEKLGLFAQPAVGATGPNQATGNSLYHAPGVVVDRSARPNKVYVLDSGNNRILGFRALGHCVTPMVQECTADGDCPGSSCRLEPGREADLIFGQVDAGGGACNRDDNIGTRATPADDTLCLTPMPLAANTAEYWRRHNADVDDAGNLYVADVHNNRVLRFNQPLSLDSSDGKGDAHADFVWGQPNMTSRTPGCSDRQLNFAEGEIEPAMAWGVSTDHDGGVWVADTMNHRVLHFSATSTVATAVIGQPNFVSCNQVCDRSSYQLCLPLEARPTPDGSELWVLDQNSSDGLPFSSRLVIFHSQANGWLPNRIRVPLSGYRRDNSGPKIFQGSGFIFKPSLPGVTDPYPSGFAFLNEHEANRALLLNHDGGGIITAIGSVEDPPGSGSYRRGCMDYGPCSQTFGLDARVTGDVRDYRVCWTGGSIGIDSDNNIYLASEWPTYVSRFHLPYIPVPNPNPGVAPSKCPPDPNGGVAGGNVVTDARVNQPVGMTVYNVAGDPTKQLIVQDRGRYLVWNDYMNRTNGEPADIIVATTTVGSNQLPARSYHAIDDLRRMWTSDGHGKIIVYQLPFAVTGTNDPIVPTCAGCSTNPADSWGMFQATLEWANDGNDLPYFLPEGSGFAFDTHDPQHKAIWVSAGNRLLRIANYDKLGIEKLKVDMVLGQADKQSNECNRGLTRPNERTLCEPRFIAFDRLGNLFVVENIYECHGNNRIVVYLAADLHSSTQLFPLLAAKKVFVAPNFTRSRSCPGLPDGPGSPVALAFDSANHVVIADDGGGWGFPPPQRYLHQLWWYRDPLARDNNGQFIQGQPADALIRLPMGAPGELGFDAADNLLVQDHTWSRVWLLNLDGETDPLTGRSRWLTFASKCGNGIFELGEQCEDGNLVSGDGCDANCTPTACGNGIVTTGEECDDGNSSDTDDCKHDCTYNVCGDAVFRVGGEECEDGNTVDGDGCSSSCKIELIPGGGPPSSDCRHEWLTIPAPQRATDDLPTNRLECNEGNPTCDFGAGGDDACTFHVALCFNANEPRFVCAAADVASVRLQQPLQARPRAGGDTANRDSLEAALGGIGGGVRGLCVHGPQRGRLCAANSDCDSSVGSADGSCRGRFVTFEPPMASGRCTAFADVNVPLRRTTNGVFKGKRRLRLKVSASIDPVTSQPPPADKDSLLLVCNP